MVENSTSPEASTEKAPQDASFQAALGQSIGRYKLLEKIGEGGCGVVYVAEQFEPVRRRVALKLIKLGMDTKAVVARFEAERQALAMMDHPNIAKVLDAGSTGAQPDGKGNSADPGQAQAPIGSASFYGRPYFVMELVRGIKITDYCDQNHLATRERLELFIQVCHAIQHAHQKGIIHRDIKPSNILVTLHDGVPIPKVIDFGIAKATEGRLTDATVYTQLHQFIGTPAYMSPEQAEMSGLDVDTRSDIYSLGVLFYELLTGRTPFDALELAQQGLDALRKTIREREPVRPSTRVATLPGEELTTTAKRRSSEAPQLIHLLKGDLDWIVMKCLEKDRTRRYETANGLALDLKRHLNNEPVVARPPSTTYRLQKAWRRNKVGFTAGAAVVVALCVGLITASWQAVRATKAEREQARQRASAEQARAAAESAQAKEAEQRKRAEEGERATRDLLYFANMGLAQSAWEEGDMERLQGMLDQTRDFPQRGFEWFYWARQLHREAVTLRGHGEQLLQVVFSPDGEWAAARAYISDKVQLWRTLDGQRFRALQIDAPPVASLAFSPDGQQLAVGLASGKLALWDLKAWQKTRQFDLRTNALDMVTWSPDSGRLLAIASSVVCLVDAHSGQQLVRTTNYSGTPLGVLPGARLQTWIQGFFGESDQACVVVRDAEAFRVWEVESGKMLIRFDTPDKNFGTFAQCASYLATVTRRDGVHLFDLNSGQSIGKIDAPGGSLARLAFSPDGKVLAIGTPAGAVHFWRVAGKEEIGVLKGPQALSGAISFSPDGRKLAALTRPGPVVKIWEWEPLLERPVASQPANNLRVVISQDATRCLVLTNLGAPSRLTAGRLVHGDSGHTIASLPPFEGGLQAFTADGSRFTTISSNAHRLHLWDARTGRILTTLEDKTNVFSFVELSADGTLIATSHRVPADRGFSPTPGCKIWDALSGRQRFLIPSSDDFLVGFSPDGHWVATQERTRGPLVTVWDTTDGRQVKRIEAPSDTGRLSVRATFSPDGKRLAVASLGRLRIVPFQPGKDALPADAVEIESSSIVQACVFSPDGRRLLTENLGVAKLWDVASGREVLTLKTPEFCRACFSTDGQAILLGTPEGLVQRLEAATPPQVAVWSGSDEQTQLMLVAASARAHMLSFHEKRDYRQLEETGEQFLARIRKAPGAESSGALAEFSLRLASGLLSDAQGELRDAARAQALRKRATDLLAAFNDAQLEDLLEAATEQYWGILARAGHWTEELAWCERALRQPSAKRSDLWATQVLLSAKLGNAKRVAEAGAAMLAEAETNIDSGDWSNAMILLAAGRASSNAVLSASRVITNSLAQVPQYSGYWVDVQRINFAQALLLYRQNKFTETRDALSRIEPAADDTNLKEWVKVLTTMTRFRLNERSQPGEALSEAAAQLKSNLLSPESGLLDEGWSDWLILDLLVHEAQELIKTDAAPTRVSKG